MIDHRYVRAERSSEHRGLYAVCSCGWRSDVTTTAGLAGTMWDQHREASIDPADTEPAP
jgi:hypothetical protein